ncbi:hypothetical protein Taro_028547 [Colocasia esculenta]|uniref:Uncharacterized protein n=1 Tax=Colocasia esculenta TaxID=4460 RepID=A0A843VXK3_COLES|nr:hypothetical protein [Colocasia esculenta]
MAPMKPTESKWDPAGVCLASEDAIGVMDHRWCGGGNRLQPTAATVNQQSVMHKEEWCLNSPLSYVCRCIDGKVGSESPESESGRPLATRLGGGNTPGSAESDDDDDDDDPDPEFTVAARASRRSYAEEDERRRGLGTSGAHLSRDDSRRSLPRSTSVHRGAGALGCGGRLSDVHAPTQGPMDAYLYRSRSVKQLGIKHALKGVKATAKAAKGAIKGVPAHTAESPYFQSMLDAIAEAGPVSFT